MPKGVSAVAGPGTSQAFRCRIVMGRIRAVAVFLPLLLLVALLVGPTIAAYAILPTGLSAVIRPPHAVIRVHPFEDLGASSCIAYPPLHLGPITQRGELSLAGPLWSRMTSSVFACADGWHGHVALSVTVDRAGMIVGTRAVGDDHRVNACVRREAVRGGLVGMHGPGTLTVGYFMGNSP
jgi:hypothetical protein